MQLATLIRELIVRWREDASGTYRTWFLWDERLKNFRSIRRGLGEKREKKRKGDAVCRDKTGLE